MNKKFGLFVIGFLLLLNIFCWKEVFALSCNDNLKVYFLNVGQGDSAFIKTPENHQIIIDGGPNSSVLENIFRLIPFWDKTIDLVILTHPDRDHMQGLTEILKKYKVDYILQTGVEKNSDEYNEWIKILENQKKMGSNIIAVKAGDNIYLGNVEIKILFPLENSTEKIIKNSANEDCVVSKLVFVNNSFLFTSDISAKAEKEIIEKEKNVNADVLKVAHHGSKYSTSEYFLANTNFKFAVISVGKNSYGHPTPEVLQRLEKFGIYVLRTDMNNNIEFISDGNNIKLLNNN